MRAQLLRLAEAAAVSSAVTIRVLPFSSGMQAAGAGAPVTIVRFAGAPGLGLVYLPRLGHEGICLVNQDDLTCYTKVFAALSASALTPAGSALFLRELADAPEYAVPDASTRTSPTGWPGRDSPAAIGGSAAGRGSPAGPGTR